MKRTITLLLAGTLLVAAMIAGIFAFVEGRPVSILLFFVSVIGLIYLYRIDRKREEREAIEAATYEAARFHALSTLDTGKDFKLDVMGSYQIGFSIVAVIVGVLLLLFSATATELFARLMLLLAAVPLALVGLVILIGGLRARGNPIIELTEVGIRTPWSGLILWEHVHEICLQDIRYRTTRLQRPDLLVPELQRLSRNFAIPMRWIYTLRPRNWNPYFCIVLRDTSEPPKVIYKIAKWLWTKNAGRTEYKLP